MIPARLLGPCFVMKSLVSLCALVLYWTDKTDINCKKPDDGNLFPLLEGQDSGTSNGNTSINITDISRNITSIGITSSQDLDPGISYLRILPVLRSSSPPSSLLGSSQAQAMLAFLPLP
ncbi:NT-3 growth factor receptor [Chelonia mydas]|uniref:NT-3 growth factor receptor n=1 Tax=Chelonia mydas TaxID=8469 RepID=M7C450_CHEMY|nr:NT-3 growth factor receptor [Chelonia mydas]